MKKDKTIKKPYKIAHQILSLTGINFTRQTVIGFTELTLIPTKDSFRYIWINCKQSCIYKVTLNDTLEVPFQYFDPLIEVCPSENKVRNLSYFNKNQLNAVASVDPELGRGELVITISSEAQHLIQEGKSLRVGIEFSLEKPQAGLHFVVPNGEGTPAERGVHMFSYGHENLNRLWFPCIDTYNEVCTWRLEFTVDEAMVAVSCGELTEIVYTADMRRKTYHYVLNVPTAAPNIALAIGPFKIYTDPYMNEITHFCLPQLLPVMKVTSKHLHEAFEFFEEILSCRFPYSCFKQVYVDEAYNDLHSYATMSIVSVNLLCSTRIIDQVFETRKALVLSVAQQFFSCFISRHSWADAWLTGGISRYLMGLHLKRYFGFNEYKDWIHTELREVIEYEEKYGSITLDPSSAHTNGAPYYLPGENADSSLTKKDNFYFSVLNAHACSPKYVEMYYKKAHLVIRMLEFKIGYELMTQVLNKHLSLGLIASEHKGHPSGWHHMVISTATFTKTIFTVTGKDITVFCDQWVREGGHAKFKMRFLFNRKRNIVEMTIEQNSIGEFGIKRYVGPLVVWLQELDGTFKHTLQIEHIVAKKEIVCHSKSRRNKKKKIPLCTGEEVDMDLSHLDVDSPVLWLRMDPDMTMMRSVEVEQPDNQWQYQLKHERDVTAQTDAITALEKFARIGAATPEMRNTLNAIIENEQCYYKVRCRAALCLTHVANAMLATWSGLPAMTQYFKKTFGSFSCPNIIRQLDFTNFQNYFLLKTLPVAMAGLRDVHKEAKQDVLNFLLDLFKYSDNTKNQFSDNYYRAALIDALATAVTPQIVSQDPTTITPESLPENIRKILAEVTRCLNLEKLLPCYKHTVTCACLRALRTLQKNGYLPPKSEVFKRYASYYIFIDIRLSAIDQLIDFLPSEGACEDMEFLLSLIESDPVPQFRYQVIQRLAVQPPFQMGQSHRLDTELLLHRLWTLMCCGEPCDARVRCSIMDLYFALYGSRRPACIPATNSDGDAAAEQVDRKINVLRNNLSCVPLPTLPISSTPMVFSQLPKTSQHETSTAPGLIRVKQEVISDEETLPLSATEWTSAPFDRLRIKEEVDVYEEVIQPVVTTEVTAFASTEGPFSTGDYGVHDHNGHESMPDCDILNPDVATPLQSQDVQIDSNDECSDADVGDQHEPQVPRSLITETVSVSSSSFTPVNAPTADDTESLVRTLPSASDAIGTARHKLKKRKKDKKHKKHKKHKHKLDKFATEENLSSGSSNPPSPSSGQAPSAPGTPNPPEVEF